MKTKQQILNIDDIKLLVDSFYAKVRADVNFKDISRIVEFLNTNNDGSFDKTISTSTKWVVCG